MKTPQDVQQAIENIKGLANDPVAAHAAEDSLYYQVLQSVGNGTMENLQTACKIALKSKNIKFSRGYRDAEQK